MEPDLFATIRPRLPLSLRPSLGPLRHGPADPTTRFAGDGFWRATRTPEGPATIHLQQRGPEVEASTWGPGARWLIDRAPAMCGEADALDGWEPDRHPVVGTLAQRLQGLRMIASGLVVATAVPVVLEQKVQSAEAHRSWARLVRSWGEPAPGPEPLHLPPGPERLAREPYWAYHRFGIERRRAEVIRGLCARVFRVEEAARLPWAERRARLEAFPGVGVWTSAKCAQVVWADADAVPVGDYNLPEIVVHALTGHRGGDDDAMLELLEPVRPHRGRAARILKIGHGRPARRAPRARLREFRAS